MTQKSSDFITLYKFVMRPRIEAITLDVDGHAIAGIRQHDPAMSEAPKLLCIHGWLDNANSFVPLMPYLPAFDLVAIDLPGCGFSDSLEHGYALHDLCYQLTQIISALGWQQCHVLGHSLGGCMAPMLAAASPNAIQTLSLIEALGPMSEPAEKLPERMAKAMSDKLDPSKFASRLFNTKQAAIEARLRAAKMAPSSAKLIIDRQVVEDEGGYRWRFDPRWRMASSQYQTEEQVLSVLAAVQCPTLTVMADDGLLHNRHESKARLAALVNNHSVMLPGQHHLHMDTPEPVAAAINGFLQTLPALGG